MTGYLDRDHYDAMIDARAEVGEPIRPLPSQRPMVAASLVADDIKACHHSSYALPPRRIPAPSSTVADAENPGTSTLADGAPTPEGVPAAPSSPAGTPTGPPNKQQPRRSIAEAA